MADLAGVGPAFHEVTNEGEKGRVFACQFLKWGCSAFSWETRRGV